MSANTRRSLGVFLTSCIVVAWGCGDDKPSVSSSTTEAYVSGTVSIKGKPATSGKVVFDPSNHLRKNEQTREAPISKEGTYKIRTLVGLNSVRVESKEAEKAGAQYDSQSYEVPGNDSTFEISLPLSK